jgi:hypothetical protein
MSVKLTSPAGALRRAPWSASICSQFQYQLPVTPTNLSVEPGAFDSDWASNRKLARAHNECFAKALELLGYISALHARPCEVEA